MPKELTFKQNDPGLLELIKETVPFKTLSLEEIKNLIKYLKKYEYDPDEIVVNEGDIGTEAYIVDSGEFTLDKMERTVKVFKKGDFFGEIALIDKRPRLGTVKALDIATLYSIEGKYLERPDCIPATTSLKIIKGFARLLSSYMREGSALYRELEVLLIQDGGCAPGYNPATAFISEYLEKAGKKVFICAEGFKSLISNKIDDYRCLIYNSELYKQFEHLPGVVFSPPLREARGASFRSERFPEFKSKKLQQVAAKAILNRNVKIIVGIGGNGTLAGINELSNLLPDDIKLFFIPVTIDSDIYGTDCIGEFAGVESGAEKIRCYMADARTHDRFYFIEMMGAEGGYHALHSCLGAGAHLAVLPSSNYDLKKIAKALQKQENCVVVVAEGYKREKRKQEDYKGSAADYFRDELLDAGLKTDKRIICESFSRDIRGASPNNLDIMLAQSMARNLSNLISSNRTRQMPARLSGIEYSIPFNEIRTDNSVESDLAVLANRLFL
ncbi:MAG: 6-phosphofructokinase [Calditrichia bacterium]|nr:6-phosphofructokinase [Calditrichia bacterium]